MRSDVSVVAIATAVAAAIVLYGYVQCYILPVDFVDPLDAVSAGTGRLRVTLWSLSHFLFFAILSFFYPDRWKLMITMGVLWEILEHMSELMGRRESPPSSPFMRALHYISTCSRKSEGVTEGGGGSAALRGREGAAWWRSDGKDIVFNCIGVTVGVFLAKGREK